MKSLFKLPLVAALTVAQVLTMIPKSAQAEDDLVSLRYELRVLALPGHRFGYEFCDKKFTPIQCEKLGNPEGYTAQQLEEITGRELTQARIATGSAVVIGIAAAILSLGTVGVVGLGALGVGSSVGSGGATSLGAAIFGVSLLVLPTAGAATVTLWADNVVGWFSRINPIHQHDQADVFKVEGLANPDTMAQVEDRDLVEVADILREILE